MKPKKPQATQVKESPAWWGTLKTSDWRGTRFDWTVFGSPKKPKTIARYVKALQELHTLLEGEKWDYRPKFYSSKVVIQVALVQLERRE